MTSEPDRSPEDPLKGAGEAFEEHEKDLVDKLMARIQRDIPPGATVGEAIAEMQRAMAEDDDAKELLFRIVAVQNQNSGYISTQFEEASTRHVQYTSAMSREELELMQRLGEEIEARLPPGLSEAEREARVIRLLTEDEELAEMASRLERLTEGRMAPDEPDDEGEAPS